MNKCRVPVVPPLLVNNMFVLNCSEKAKHFIEFFSQQCKLPTSNKHVVNNTKRIDHITVQDGEILPLIRNLNPNKAHITVQDGEILPLVRNLNPNKAHITVQDGEILPPS